MGETEGGEERGARTNVSAESERKSARRVWMALVSLAGAPSAARQTRRSWIPQTREVRPFSEEGKKRGGRGRVGGYDEEDEAKKIAEGEWKKCNAEDCKTESKRIKRTKKGRGREMVGDGEEGSGP